MKRKTPTLPFDTTKQEELREANCVDIDDVKDPMVLYTIYSNFKQVKIHETDLEENEWTISDLDQITERKILTQTLTSAGYSEKMNKCNGDLALILEIYDKAV